jgi:hypothetical protein
MFRAKIDAKGIYRGIEAVEELVDGDVEVPEDCSLAPGAYIWNTEHGRFDPLPKSKRTASPDTPSLEDALYAMIEVMDIVPEECDKWAKWYKTTLAGKR